jgi:hypothetical protein
MLFRPVYLQPQTVYSAVLAVYSAVYLQLMLFSCSGLWTEARWLYCTGSFLHIAATWQCGPRGALLGSYSHCSTGHRSEVNRSRQRHNTRPGKPVLFSNRGLLSRKSEHKRYLEIVFTDILRANFRSAAWNHTQIQSRIFLCFQHHAIAIE